MTLPGIITSLESDEAGHLSRLLILLNAFDRNDKPALEGITKLAKLDFLLRYPTYFDRAMQARGVPLSRINIPEFERKTVESQMVRYRYGPWDHRYRRFLNLLAAKGLIRLETDGRAILISLTERGRQRTNSLLRDPNTQEISQRAKLLAQKLDLGPREIMNFIYKTFPEIATLAFNETIAE